MQKTIHCGYRLPTSRLLLVLALANVTLVQPSPGWAQVTQVFVANDGSGTVSVLDGGSLVETARIALPRSQVHAARGHLAALDGRWLSGGPSAREATAAGSVRLGGLPRAIATAPDGRSVYVTSQFPDIVSVIDTATHERVASIPVGLSPEGIAVSPDGRFAYVTNFDADSVSVIDTARNEVVNTVTVDDAPNAITVAPDGEHVFVTHFKRFANGMPAPGSVSVITTATNEVAIIPLGIDSELPVGIAVTSAGDRAYVTSFAHGLISVIDTGTYQVIATGQAALFSNLSAMTTDHAGRLYVADFASDTIKVIEPSLLESAGGAAQAMDPIMTVPVESFPASLALTPQEDQVYVGSFALQTGCHDECPVRDGTVAVVDLASASVANVIPVDRFPVGIAFSAPAAGAAALTRAADLPPTLNCYTIDCLDPNDCLVPLGRHQPKAGGLRSGDGEHECAGGRVKPTATPTLSPTITPTGATATATYTTAAVTGTATGTPPTATATVTQPTGCVGDCDHDTHVTVDELVLGVNIALGLRLVEACDAFDRDRSGDVTIDELVTAVNSALNDCPLPPTSTPAETATPVPSPTRTASASLSPSRTSTRTPSLTRTSSPTRTVTPTVTPTPSMTHSPTVTPTPTRPGLVIKEIDATALIEVNGTLFFRGNDSATGIGLWRSDGTEAGTVMVKSVFLPHPALMKRVNDRLFFVASDSAHGAELWKSDGTELGTVLVKDIRPGPQSSAIENLVRLGDTLFFVADDGSSGSELWKSDGSEGGTVRVKDIRPGPAGSLEFFADFTDLNGTLFFAAAGGVTSVGLWRSDGTEAGTVLVKALQVPWPEPEGFLAVLPTQLTNVNGTLFFQPLLFFRSPGPLDGLWRSDGTSDGTGLVKHFDLAVFPYFINVGGTLFFVAGTNETGRELWKSNGTEIGTVLVKDIYSGPMDSNPSELTNVNGTLYFAARDGTHGEELWRTDGTESGTVMVKEIMPGALDSSPRAFVPSDGAVFFVADSGPSLVELWRSDGTASGTFPLTSLLPGLLPCEGVVPSSVVVAGATLFFTTNDPARGSQLWAVPLNALIPSSGTPPPTSLPCNTPTPTPTIAPAANLTVRVFESDNHTLYYVVSADISDPSLHVRLTSLAFSANPVVSLTETVQPPDSVATSLSGATAALVPLERILRTRVLWGFEDENEQVDFDPTLNDGTGWLSVPTSVTIGDPSFGEDPLLGNVLDPITTSSPFLPDPDPAFKGTFVPAAALATNIERARQNAPIRVSAIVFPNPAGTPLVSDGATCDRTRLACDPADTDPRTCFGGACNVFGGERAGQNVTLDHTLGVPFGNPGAQDDIGDGVILRHDVDSGEKDFVVFVIQPGAGALPLEAQASGFLLDEDGRVLGAVGP
jgi:ELWxxDGT repeat protein/YVTN family beta-propeller protein